MKLTAEQSAALKVVADADRAYRDARATLKARIAAEIAARLDSEIDTVRNRRNAAAFHAFRLGVPKRQIGIEGLNTSAPATYNEAIDAGRAYVGAAEPSDTIATAAAIEPLYVNRFGQVMASNEPYTRTDAGWTFTTAAGDTVPVAIRDGGMDVATDADYMNPAAAVLTSPEPFGFALREAGKKLLTESD